MGEVDELSGVSSDDINKAELSFYVIDSYTPETDSTALCSLHVIEKEWVEKEVTWNEAAKGESWYMINNWVCNDPLFVEEDGGDIELEPVDISVNKGIDKWETYDVTSAIKKFIDKPESNHGFTIRNSKGKNMYHSYISSENSAKKHRPKLKILYGEPAIKYIFKPESRVGIKINTSGQTFNIYIPFRGKYSISLFNVQGQCLTSFTGTKSRWYNISNINSSELCVICVKHGNNSFTMKTVSIE